MALTVSSANGLPLDVLSRIAEDATVGFALVTVPDWRMIYANPAFRQLVGIGQDLAGKTLSQVFPAAAEDITDLLAAPAHTGRTLSRRGFPLRISPDRPETWWDFDLIPLPGSTGATDSIMVITREVTDHVLARREAEQARAALHASEERLRLAMAAGNVYCWDWDLGTGQVTWSDGLEAAMLMQPGGFGGTLDAFRALVHPDDRDRIAKALNQALAGVAPYDVQFRMIRADGSVRWTATRATVLHDDAGKPTRVVGIDVDISQFKETEAALRNSEMLLRATLDSAPVGVSIIDRDLRFIHVNRHLAEADGVPADAYPGRTVQDVLGELGERLAPIYERVLETGTSVENLSIAGVLRDTPDTKREWLASYHPVRTSEGEVVALNAVVAEITGQRETEQRLSDAQDLLRSVIESVSDSVTVRDLDGRFVFLNKAAARRLGTDPDQALGRTTQDILPSDLLAHINRHLEQVMRTGLPAGVEETISLGGVTRIYHTVRSPWRDAAGMLRGVITVARDITDRKRTEQVLADANRELERRIAERTRALGDAARDLEEEIKQRVEAQSMLLQAQKLEALGQLTSGVAHDFNNVLAAISGSLELLRRGLTNDRQIRWIENGQAAVSRAVGLTRQLLGFARRQPLAPSVINLNAMLAGTREFVTHSLTPNVVLDVALAPDTWPVMADPNQLQVALINLAVNARDAMPDGGMLRITTRNMTVPAAGLPNPTTGDILPAGQYVTIAVADTGIGMSPEVAARVLEPFFTTKALGLGTGLGLPMVYGFATQSGGTILIDSRLHQGTTVEIVLPRSALAAEVADETTTLQPGRHGDADLLVVDDDPNVRIVTAGLLRDLGYDVIEAASAETAYALASTERLDLIITDVMMARSDGLQLASRLRAEQPSVPILFVTGRADLPELKGEAVLQKPFTRAELAAAVLRKLRRDMGTDDTHDPADRLLGRIQTEALKWLYSAWRTRRQAAGGPPRLADLPLDSYGLSDRMFVAEVRGASHVRRFEYLSVGRRLAARLGRSLEGHQRLVANGYDFGELALGTLDAAYLRCCRTRSPTYEFARYDFGDGAPMIFERLLLPFSENGEGITHMAGVVLISERTSRTSESGQEDTE